MPNIWIIKVGFGDILGGPMLDGVLVGSKPFASSKMSRPESQTQKHIHNR